MIRGDRSINFPFRPADLADIALILTAARSGCCFPTYKVTNRNWSGTNCRRTVSGYPEVEGEPEVVVLTAEQAAGQGVVHSHHLAATGGGLAGTDQRRGAVAGDLLGEGGEVPGSR